MKRTALWLFILTAMVSNPVFAAGIDRMDAAATVALSDKNGDGRIDREEYHQRMTEVFFFIDANKDGSLTLAELKVVSRHRTRHEGKMPSSTTSCSPRSRE